VNAILSFVINALLGAVLDRIQLWWNARQAEYYRRQAEVAKQKLDSLKTGMTAEESVLTAAVTAVTSAEAQRNKHDAMIEELKARAKRRKGQSDA
jgi:hypothetical protein